MKRIYLVGTMILLTLLYALCYTSIKAGLPFLPPLLFGGLRALIGGSVLLPILVFLKVSLLPPKHEWKWVALLGLATFVVYFGMFLSPGQTGAAIASILGNLSPLFTVLLAACVLHEKLSLSARLALLFGILGILFISFPDVFGKSAYGMTGLVLALAASGGSAVSNIVVKLMPGATSIIRISAWQLLLGSLPLLLISFFTEQNSPLIWSTKSVGLLLFLGIVGTAFVTATWYTLIERHNVGKLSLFLFLIPVFGLAIAWLVFREPLHSIELLGIGSVLIATALLIVDTVEVEKVSA